MANEMRLVADGRKSCEKDSRMVALALLDEEADTLLTKLRWGSCEPVPFHSRQRDEDLRNCNKDEACSHFGDWHGEYSR